MNRRRSLKALAAASVGALAIGYWAKDLDEVKDYFSKSFFKPTEQDAIMSIVDTILPRGELPYGAVELGVPIYIMDYLQSCIPPKDLQNVKSQLIKIDVKANELYDDDFEACTQVQREELLLQFGSSENEAEKMFFDLMKDQTIQGFRSTEEVLTNHFDYKVVPGEFDGCLDVKAETII